MLDEIPFPIQRLQTNNGVEFLAYKVRDRLLQLGVKHRPIRPASPHLNGKVERAQKTVLAEFYAITSLDSPSLDSPSLDSPSLAEELGICLWTTTTVAFTAPLGKTPMQRWTELQREDSVLGRRHRAIRSKERGWLRRAANTQATLREIKQVKKGYFRITHLVA